MKFFARETSSANRQARRGQVRLARALLGVAIGVTPGVSNADPTSAESMALFNEALRLRKEGKRSEACPLFIESHRLDPSAGKLLNVADCHEQEGKLATAWGEFLSAAVLYKSRGQKRGLAESQRRASLLEPRLPRLTLRVKDSAAGLLVKRNDRAVEPAQFGQALPIDPGEYVITAEAPGRISVRMTVAIGPQADVTVVDVPPLAERRATALTPPPRRVDDHAASPPTAGYVIGGVGVAALGAGAVFGALALSSNAKAEKACRSFEECSPGVATDHRDRATAMAWASDVGIGVGLVGLAVSTYLILRKPPGRSTTAAPEARTGVTLEAQPAAMRAVVRF